MRDTGVVALVEQLIGFASKFLEGKTNYSMLQVLGAVPLWFNVTDYLELKSSESFFEPVDESVKLKFYGKMVKSIIILGFYVTRVL